MKLRMVGLLLMWNLIVDLKYQMLLRHIYTKVTFHCDLWTRTWNLKIPTQWLRTMPLGVFIWCSTLAFLILLIIFILLCNMCYIRIPLLCWSCLLSADRSLFYFYYLIYSAHPLVHRPFPIFLLTLHRWRFYSLFSKTLQTECSCSASRIGTLCFTILFLKHCPHRNG